MSFYGYLNLESTKTYNICILLVAQFYGYLNLESTKTACSDLALSASVLRLLKS